MSGVVAAAQAPPLLASKLTPPAPRPRRVARPRLIERLNDGLAGRLTLIAAAAGFGKTTLLSDWLATTQRLPVGWLALDEGDNDPARFWAYVAAALRGAGVEIPAAFDAAVSAPGTPVLETALPMLINALAATAREHVLVLDDYHLIADPAIHDGVRFLVARAPLASHLVICTRTEPPVDVSRLRARGELGEIDSDHLRFSDAEAAALLNDTLELGLPDERLRKLSARTEGWAAGLYLAGLSLRDRGELADDLEFDRHLVDYLGDEVLAAQDGEVRRFLLDTCVLDRFCAPLCDAVRSADSSKRLLATLEQANLFLVPLDRRREWFRYHHVFRDVLRRELEDTTSAEYRGELHARAGDWFSGAGDVSVALGHLLAAGREQAAADLVAGAWNEALQRGRGATVERWLEALPAGVVEGDPRLCLTRAWLALDLGEQAAAERWAAATAAADDGRPLLEGGATVASGVAMLRATLAYRAGDLGRAEELGARAVELEAAPDSSWRAVALATLGAARHFRGAPSEAVVPHLEEAVGIAQAGANSMAVLRAQGTLAAATFAAGDAETARRWVAAADVLRTEQSLDEYWMASLATAVAGRLAADAGDLERARERLERAVVLARRGASRPEQIYALSALAPVQATIGEAEAAAATLRSARLALRESPSPGMFAHVLDEAERRLRGRPARPAPDAVEELSSREMSVLRLLGTQLSVAQIGDELYVSRNTVKTHVRGIYRKLGADGRAAAVARARELGLL